MAELPGSSSGKANGNESLGAVKPRDIDSADAVGLGLRRPRMSVGGTKVLESRRSGGFHGRSTCSMRRRAAIRYVRNGKDE